MFHKQTRASFHPHGGREEKPRRVLRDVEGLQGEKKGRIKKNECNGSLLEADRQKGGIWGGQQRKLESARPRKEKREKSPGRDGRQSKEKTKNSLTYGIKPYGGAAWRLPWSGEETQVVEKKGEG